MSKRAMPEREVLSTWDSSILDRIETRTIDLFGYRFKLLAHEHISRKIEEKGIYEAAQTRLLPTFLTVGGDALDVGANIGYYTMWLARMSLGRGSVHAFEPNPLPFAILEENVAANGLRNVFVNNLAVGKTNEVTRINLGLELPGQRAEGREYNLGGWSLARKKEGDHEVRVVSIDEYVEEKKLKDVSFIKIDVEGFERQVLQGAVATLKAMRPAMLIEFAAPNERRRNQAMHIIDFLRTRKYNLAVVEGRPFPHLRQLREQDTAEENFRFYAFAVRRDLGFLGA
jgi:FkbM family methyltransferase